MLARERREAIYMYVDISEIWPERTGAYTLIAKYEGKAL